MLKSLMLPKIAVIILDGISVRVIWTVCHHGKGVESINCLTCSLTDQETHVEHYAECNPSPLILVSTLIASLASLCCGFIAIGHLSSCALLLIMFL